MPAARAQGNPRDRAAGKADRRGLPLLTTVFLLCIFRRHWVGGSGYLGTTLLGTMPLHAPLLNIKVHASSAILSSRGDYIYMCVRVLVSSSHILSLSGDNRVIFRFPDPAVSIPFSLVL